MALSIPKNLHAAVAWLKSLKDMSHVGQKSEARIVPSVPELREQLAELSKPRGRDPNAAIREAAACGVVMRAVGTDSHTVEGPAGRFLFEGTGITDESFANDPLGLLNVTKAWRFLNKAQPSQIVEFPIDLPMMKMLSGNDIDPDYAATLTPYRRDLPVLFVYVSQGLFLVDGSHRVLTRAVAGKEHVQGFVFDEAAFSTIRCKLWQIDANGDRIEIDTTGGISGGAFLRH